MRLDGIYTGPDVNVPDGIQARGTSGEFARVPVKPTLSAPAVPTDALAEGECIAIYPAQREVVQQIARHVEVDCTDQRLIDWMEQRPGGQP